MKHIIFAAGLALAVSYPVLANNHDKKEETRKVCVDVKDKDGKVVKNKDGTNKQNCKEVKAHQKHEGTKVPEKK